MEFVPSKIEIGLKRFAEVVVWTLAAGFLFLLVGGGILNRRADALDRRCNRLHPGDSEDRVRNIVGNPTTIRHCGADLYHPDPSVMNGHVCAKEYWYDTHLFGGGWIVWFDENNRVIDTARLVSP